MVHIGKSVYFKKNRKGKITLEKISICTACFNEEDNIEKFYNVITSIMEKIEKYDYEILFADNNSTDCSQIILRKLAKQDKRVKVIFNNRNFGALRSGKNCLFRATGDAIITIPCDLQEPPEMIPSFIEEWEKGYKVVWGQKTKSKENPFMYFIRSIYYKILKTCSSLPQYKHVTGFGIMDKEVIEHAKKMQDNYMGIKTAILEMGYKIKLVEYTQQKRQGGKSSYNFLRYTNLAISNLINSSDLPLRAATTTGLILSVISFIIGMFYFINKLMYWDKFSVGVAPIVIGLFFLGSVQLMFIGIVGEYVGQILKRVTPAPLVIERETLNFDDKMEL